MDYGRTHAVAEGTMMAPDSYRFSCGMRVLCVRGIAEYNFTSLPTNGGGNIARPTDESKHCLTIFVSGQPPERPPSVSADPLRLEIEHSLNCVDTLQQPRHGTPAQARAALTVSPAANRSLASGVAEPVQRS